MTLTDTRPWPVPTFPFSMFDPVHLGRDEYGVRARQPGRTQHPARQRTRRGKSSGRNLIAAHGALSADCKLILVDGKLTELRDCRRAAPQVGAWPAG